MKLHIILLDGHKSLIINSYYYLSIYLKDLLALNHTLIHRNAYLPRLNDLISHTRHQSYQKTLMFNNFWATFSISHIRLFYDIFQ